MAGQAIPSDSAMANYELFNRNHMDSRHSLAKAISADENRKSDRNSFDSFLSSLHFNIKRETQCHKALCQSSQGHSTGFEYSNRTMSTG